MHADAVLQGNDTKTGGREESLGDNFLMWAGEPGLRMPN